VRIIDEERASDDGGIDLDPLAAPASSKLGTLVPVGAVWPKFFSFAFDSIRVLEVGGVRARGRSSSDLLSAQVGSSPRRPRQ
jgi:hypothetical protein